MGIGSYEVHTASCCVCGYEFKGDLVDGDYSCLDDLLEALDDYGWIYLERAEGEVFVMCSGCLAKLREKIKEHEELNPKPKEENEQTSKEVKK